MTAPLRVEHAGHSHVGHVRRENEDSWAANPAAGVFAVADGMGGHAHGRLASSLVAQALEHLTLPEDLEAAWVGLADAVHAANRAVFAQAQAQGAQMGATLVGLLVRGEEFIAFWAGDSRAYLMRAGQLVQLTRDHTQVQEMLDRGLLSVEEAAVHPLRHVLSRAVGVQDDLAMEAVRDRLAAHDVFLLCSDGLHGVVEDARIAAILAEAGLGAGPQLIEAALAAGGPDNVTVALVGIAETTLLVLEGARS